LKLSRWRTTWGHTPLATPQDALNACLINQPDSAGFEHNLQSLRWRPLEERYPSYNGLNLTFETREGILALLQAAPHIEARAAWQRFCRSTAPARHATTQPEAQPANLADEIARHNAHDIDDRRARSGL
jgi:dGTPase